MRTNYDLTCSNQNSKNQKTFMKKENRSMQKSMSPCDVKQEVTELGICTDDIINISVMTEEQFQAAADAAAKNNSAGKRNTAKYENSKVWSDISTAKWEAKQEGAEHNYSKFRAPTIKNSDETEISGVITKIAYGVFSVKVDINYYTTKEDREANNVTTFTKVGEYIVTNGTLINCRLGSKIKLKNKTDAKGKNKRSGYELVEGDAVRIIANRYNVMGGGKIIQRL